MNKNKHKEIKKVRLRFKVLDSNNFHHGFLQLSGLIQHHVIHNQRPTIILRVIGQKSALPTTTTLRVRVPDLLLCAIQLSHPDTSLCGLAAYGYLEP